MVWEVNGTPDTLSSPSDIMSITDMEFSNFNQFLSHHLASGATAARLRYNGDAGSNYARRISNNGGTDSTNINQTGIGFEAPGDQDVFAVNYTYSIQDDEKLVLLDSMNKNLDGAGSTPTRKEVVAKYVGTTQISKVSVDNIAAGDYDVNSNLSSFGDDPVAPPTPVGGWKELGRDTLASPGDTLSVTGLANKRYYMVLSFTTDTGGTISQNLRFNNDSGNNYARRQSTNGGTDSAVGNLSGYALSPSTAAEPQYSISYHANLSGKETLSLAQVVQESTPGAATAPDRKEWTGKWADTSVINRIDNVNLGTGDYDTNSELVILGWDPDDTHTDNFWEEIASTELGSAGDNLSTGTFTAKKYLWVQIMTLGTGGNINHAITFNGDTGTNYARRTSANGASDNTVGNLTSFITGVSSANINYFRNLFIINNTTEEKLIINNQTEQNTAGDATAPDRLEAVGKWANTANQITEIDVDNTDTGNYNIGSIIKVWGSD